MMGGRGDLAPEGSHEDFEALGVDPHVRQVVLPR